jgi:catechol 2,3-dioxygenase-like lactoylglutathione lyase family enzyme
MAIFTHVTVGTNDSSRARAFYDKVLGARDEGAVGPRSWHPTAYAGYLRDLDGNKICAYCFNAV